MPRKARVQTSTNVYHAILRGVNKQQSDPRDALYETYLDDGEFLRNIQNINVVGHCGTRTGATHTKRAGYLSL